MDEVREIATNYVQKIRKQMELQGKTVTITERAIDLLTEKGFNTAYGARFLKRHIDEKVKLPITTMWRGAAQFTVDAEDGEILTKPSTEIAETL